VIIKLGFHPTQRIYATHA